MERFPLNYFKNSFSPILSFTKRQYLKVWQIVLIFFVLTGCLLMPISFSLGRIEQVSLNDFVPEAIAVLTTDFVEELQTMTSSEEGIAIPTDYLLVDDETNILGFYTNESSALSAIDNKTGLIITPSAFLIKEADRPLIQQAYLSNSELTTVASTESLINELSRQWFESNRMAIVLTNYINVWFLMFLSSLMLILGSSLFLSFMRLSHLYSIKSYRESLHVCLHAFLLPTLLAMMLGWFSQDPIMMLTAQGIGFVLVLLWIYWKTHFQDQYVSSQQVDNQDKDSLVPIKQATNTRKK